MKVWVGEYFETGAWGYLEHKWAVVVAETESVALGLLLERYESTFAVFWSIAELDTTKQSVVRIT